MSLGQCVCACSSVRKAIRTVGDPPQAAQDKTKVIKASPRTRWRMKSPVGNALLIVGISITGSSEGSTVTARLTACCRRRLCPEQVHIVFHKRGSERRARKHHRLRSPGLERGE